MLFSEVKASLTAVAQLERVKGCTLELKKSSKDFFHTAYIVIKCNHTLFSFTTKSFLVLKNYKGSHKTTFVAALQENRLPDEVILSAYWMTRQSNIVLHRRDSVTKREETFTCYTFVSFAQSTRGRFIHVRHLQRFN